MKIVLKGRIGAGQSDCAGMAGPIGRYRRTHAALPAPLLRDGATINGATT